MPEGRILLHMPRHMAAVDGRDLSPFYKDLTSALREAGGEVAIRHRDFAALETVPPGPDFHFVHNGRIDRPGVLNSGFAYIAPYWYVDPKGIFGDSSLADLTFDPEKVAPGPAQRFFSRMEKRLKLQRKSRYDQPIEVAQFPPGCIAVFLQDWSDPVERARFMTAREMLETVLAHTDGRPVVVKPHPRIRGPETFEILHWLAAEHPGVIVTEGNLHDILASAAVSVSISSTVTLEGMQHRVPAVVFGQTDFHHCAETVRIPADWPGALQRAVTRDWPFEAFLFWFFRENCVALGEKQTFPRILERMIAKGADFAALGLTR
jgi:hypothetical protein